MAPIGTFTLAEEEALIDFYQKTPFLWDNRTIDYNNKQKRISAYQHVCKLLGTDRYNKPFTVSAIRLKIKNLRTTFQREYKKILGSSKDLGSPEVYTPRWIHFTKLMFLKDTCRVYNSADDMEATVTVKSEDDNVDLFPEDTYLNSPVDSDGDIEEDHSEVYIENLNDDDDGSTPNGILHAPHVAHDNDSSAACSPLAKKRRHVPSTCSAREETPANKVLRTSGGGGTAAPPQPDSTDFAFGKYLALSLAKIQNAYYKEVAKVKMLEVLLEYTFKK